MLMLKKTYEKKLGEMVDSHNRLIESKDKEIKALRNQIKENENNYMFKNDMLRADNENLSILLQGKENELKEIEIKLSSFRGKVGGLSKQAQRVPELEKELKEKNKQIEELKINLDKAEKLITEYVKPTKVETRYSVLKVDKSKLVDSERRMKKEQLKKAAETINKRGKGKNK